MNEEEALAEAQRHRGGSARLGKKPEKKHFLS